MGIPTEITAGNIGYLESCAEALALLAHLHHQFHATNGFREPGKILDLSPVGQDYRFEVGLPGAVHRYCIDRGSLAIDGISLTIAELTDRSAIFWITPHTFAATNLKGASHGDPVNLEVDILAKYTEKLLGLNAGPGG